MSNRKKGFSVDVDDGLLGLHLLLELSQRQIQGREGVGLAVGALLAWQDHRN